MTKIGGNYDFSGGGERERKEQITGEKGGKAVIRWNTVFSGGLWICLPIFQGRLKSGLH
jgi:hypothetical protein